MNLKPYNKQWQKKFEKEIELIKKIIGEQIIEHHHIGSTAIPSIQSKPIIDMAILIKSFKNAPKIIDKLTTLNYKYSKKRSSTERFFFTKENPAKFHLSIANPATNYIKRQIVFRDYLIKNFAKAKEYEKLKLKLIKKYPLGENEYTYGKNEFIKKILKITEINN